VLAFCTSLDELIKTLDAARKQLWIPGRVTDISDWARDLASHAEHDKPWRLAKLAGPATPRTWQGPDDGLAPVGEVAVSEDLLAQIVEELKGSRAAPIGKRSTWPIERAFVYVDISDYSKMEPGVQLLVVQALVQIAEEAEKAWSGIEARLCIGDGYIYSFDSARGATWFAATLLRIIEAQVADEKVPEFHVRIGVHVGPVRWFRDPGRTHPSRPDDGWNYIGKGINGGSRVLSVIGKDVDDVIFVSDAVRRALRRQNAGDSAQLLKNMHNRGRRGDKHKELWRVFELNHEALT